MRSYDEIKKIWDDFKEEIKHENRYFVGSEIIEILDEFSNMHGVTSAGGRSQILYRARIGNYVGEDYSEILAPPKGKALSGRCNPEGISYLYLSTCENTAIAEVKPNKGDFVTVAEIQLDNLEVFNFGIYNSENQKKCNMLKLNEELSNLVSIINDDLKSVITIEKKNEYLPLQFIAEYVKKKGFKGFSYTSTVGEGKNYVLFEWDKIYKIIKPLSLKKIEDVKYQIEHVKQS